MSKISVFFLLLVFLEVFVMIKVGERVGVLAVLLWMVLMVVAGVAVMKSVLLKNQSMLREGRIMDPLTLLFRLFGAFLLIFPGFVSDALAVLFLLPLPSGVFGGRVSDAIMGSGIRESFIFRSYASLNPNGSRTEEQGSESPDGGAPGGVGSDPAFASKRERKTDLERAKEHFRSKKPVIDTDFEDLSDGDKKQP